MADLIDRLRRLAGDDKPPRETAREQARERLRAAVTQTPARRRIPLPRRTRHRGLIALVAVAAFAVAGAGYAALHGNGPDLSAGVACQDRASLRPDSMTSASLDGRSAIAICAQLWRRGHVDGTPADPPPLQACVVGGGGGVIRVMPGATADTCEQLGLVARPHAGGSPTQRRYAAFRQDVIRSVHRGPPRCVPPEEGRRIVRATIAEHDMPGWRAEDGPGMRGEGFSAERPCVSLAFDSARRVVLLVPMTDDAP